MISFGLFLIHKTHTQQLSPTLQSLSPTYVSNNHVPFKDSGVANTAKAKRERERERERVVCASSLLQVQRGAWTLMHMPTAHIGRG